MPSYSLELAGLDASARYVPTYDFPNEMTSGDTFVFDGWTWQVVGVAVKQFDAPGEPDRTLRCVAI